MTAPIPIASGNRLTPVRLNPPPWQTKTSGLWTAVTTAPAIGNGTQVLKWRYLDPQSVEVFYVIRPGSTTTYGSGAFQIILPVQIAAGAPDPIIPGMLNIGGSLYPLVAWGNPVSAPTSTLTVYRPNATTENIGGSGWTQTAPGTLAAGNSASFRGVYRVVA